jgi:outer membrane protein TolC
MRTGEQLATTRTLVTAGRVTRLDLVRAHQVENELEAGSSTALHRAERARNRLATLTGKTPDALHVPDASRMNGNARDEFRWAADERCETQEWGLSENARV